MEPRFVPVADHALLVEFTPELRDQANRAVVALDQALNSTTIIGLREIVPAFVNLLVDFDPLVTDHSAVEESVKSLLSADRSQAAMPRRHRALVCYEEPVAPDLAAVATACGISIDAVIDAHLAGDYRVFMYGFAPGYAYLGGVPTGIQVPRKLTPVRDVAAGSILIAGPQCLISTLRMPTGWSIIGRSTTEVLRHDEAKHFLFDIGDTVEFERIDLATYERLSGDR